MEDTQPARPAEAVANRLAESLSDHIGQNVSTVASLHERETETLTPSRRRLERISGLVARPGYVAGILCFVVLWVAAIVIGKILGFTPWDPPPFECLQGLLGLTALITTTIVLIAQIRQSKLEQQRAHLDLQVNLLTEQKVTKLISLVEELRRDLPMVRNRHDPVSESLQEATDASKVLEALEDIGLTKGGEKA